MAPAEPRARSVKARPKSAARDVKPPVPKAKTKARAKSKAKAKEKKEPMESH